MANSNSALIRRKQNQKYGYQSQRSDKQRTYDNNVGKLERLYRVKSTLEVQKGYANDRCKGIKSYVEGSDYSVGWMGSRADMTRNNISEHIVGSYQAYVQSIDGHLDAVCDEITRLENENSQLSWDILHLGSLINSLANEIEKLFN